MTESRGQWDAASAAAETPESDALEKGGTDRHTETQRQRVCRSAAHRPNNECAVVAAGNTP